ncbi:LPS export ABC transporter periplasmic protein LptC [Pseudoalteromonas sp. MMG013]|uniref:Lipopolysaccharide export system protein LptC n=1 Tax=Pseudoalteromonas aurantia 208 TaxID=1314867 RepID=A0ABR9E732_9GAMM|nr:MULTISPECIES: LPS export ABC transporter periplasmic protein LptC [Pseudoalteromonas]MBE0366810.1 lipopolysaccharide export system protein LptC [Pseudoalteromonas aurantia 208]MBQ4847074.1 LPS export ABC transporter periplasmic protein LptC [Pseudoalteromonas sp. MMG005]MBQ4861420.1 LPS export ABC transporter periplasmic protein LptC [Pseudoalteromonas sp. MMG013]
MTINRIALLIIFSMIMGWLWYPYFTHPPSSENGTSDVIAKPDYIATQLQQTIYDETGIRSHTVTADKMELYQELGFSHFEAPIFTLYNGPKNWKITATEATLYENNILILEGNVVAQNLTDKAMITHINADHIRVEIINKLMQSEQPVEITGPDLLITGKGLHADLNTDVIELINHTRTIYYDQ